MKLRRKANSEMEICEEPLVEGGNDYDYCVKLFLDELEMKNLAFHTQRWHRENLHHVKQALIKLGLNVEPVKFTQNLKQSRTVPSSYNLYKWVSK